MKPLILIIYIISGFVFQLHGQIFDINIDTIKIQKNLVYFVQKGKQQNYNCHTVLTKVEENLYEVCIEYSKRIKTSTSDEHLPLKLIKKFRTENQVIAWLKQSRFRAVKKQTGKNCPKSCHRYFDIRESVLQYEDENFISIIDYVLLEDKSKINYGSKDFYNYSFLNINKEFLIIRFSNNYNTGYIFPTENGGLIFNNKKKYVVDTDPVDLSQKKWRINLNPSKKYRTVRSAKGHQIFDRVFAKRINAKFFDDICYTDDFVLARKGDFYTIYDAPLENVIADSFNLVLDHERITQGIKNDQIFYLDNNGLTARKTTFGIVGCGVTRTRKVLRTIEKNYSSFSEHKVVLGTREEEHFRKLTNCTWVKDLNFLNNSNYFSEINYKSGFKFPNDFYLLSTKNMDYLVKIRPRNGYYSYQDSQKNLMDKHRIQDQDFQKHLNDLNDESIVELYFEGHLEGFDYDHPIKFREEELLGYWPQNRKAKYKSVSKFDGLFAKIEMPDGKGGWLDITGKEYFFN